MHRMSSTELQSLFRQSDTGYSTRLSNMGLYVSRPRTEALKRSPSHRSQQLWNSLPASLRSMTGDYFRLFKQRLRKFFT